MQSGFSLICGILVKRDAMREGDFTLRMINSVTGFELVASADFLTANAEMAALGGHFG
ncbi:hypothetical protein IMW82_11220 [Rhodanobacter sp. B2A1Ga4]|nr:hypothetical protein [Rhodanobacter sp. B2A1Ga4]